MPSSKVIQLGTKIKGNEPAPIFPEEYVQAIENAREAWPILDDWVIEFDGASGGVDGIGQDRERKVAKLFPMSIATLRYCTKEQGPYGDRSRAVLHYVLHELGHVALMAVYGHSHETRGDSTEMVQRYDREELTVERLAKILSRTAP